MSELLTVKKSLEEMASAFDAFKKTHEAKGGKASAEVDEKLAKLTAKMDDEEKKHVDYLKKLEEKEAAREKEMETLEANLRKEFEAKMGRAMMPLAGAGTEEEQLRAKKKLERKAFEKVLRAGDNPISASQFKLTDEERKVLVISNDTTGGYLAPPEWILDIIKAVVLFTPMRDIVNVRNIGTNELKQPKRTGTASASRISEIGTRAETNNPAYGLVSIQAPEMFAEAHVSMQNLEDSAFDLEQELTGEFSEQFAVTEGNEVINGNGVGKCLGILDANAGGPGTALAYTPSGSAATIAGPSGSTGDGLITMLHALKTAYAARARWLMNRQSLGAVRGLKDTQGRYLWEPSLIPGNPSAILGLPYTEAPDMPSQGANTFPIALGDWKRGYTIAQRLEMAMVRDPYTLASTGQVKFTARRRMGGQVVLAEALSLYKCATS